MEGLFTSPEAPMLRLPTWPLAGEDVKEGEKSKRLYLEVRHHVKNSSVSFPKVFDIFKAKKKKRHKKLPYEIDARNLMAYLKRVSCRDVKFEPTGNAPGRAPSPRRAFAGPNVRRAGLVRCSA